MEKSKHIKYTDNEIHVLDAKGLEELLKKHNLSDSDELSTLLWFTTGEILHIDYPEYYDS